MWGFTACLILSLCLYLAGSYSAASLGHSSWAAKLVSVDHLLSDATGYLTDSHSTQIAATLGTLRTFLTAVWAGHVCLWIVSNTWSNAIAGSFIVNRCVWFWSKSWGTLALLKNKWYHYVAVMRQQNDQVSRFIQELTRTLQLLNHFVQILICARVFILFYCARKYRFAITMCGDIISAFCILFTLFLDAIVACNLLMEDWANLLTWLKATVRPWPMLIVINNQCTDNSGGTTWWIA